MFDFLILISRYLFIIYIAVFIFQGLIYVVDERKGDPRRLPKAVSIQRSMIILMHITAYSILIWDREAKTININVAVSGIAALIYIFVSYHLLRKIYTWMSAYMELYVFFNGRRTYNAPKA